MFVRISYLTVLNAGGTWSHRGFTDMGEATKAAEAAGEDATNQEVRLCVYPHVTRKWNPAESVALSRAHVKTSGEQLASVADEKVVFARAKVDSAKKNLEVAQAAHDALVLPVESGEADPEAPDDKSKAGKPKAAKKTETK